MPRNKKQVIPSVPDNEEILIESTSEVQQMVAENTSQDANASSKSEQDNALCLVINVAKRENRGEDSPPLAYCKDNIIAVGVFDGMGGSGATEYTTPNGTHTGAYLASRRVKDVCSHFVSTLNKSYFETTDLSLLIKEDLDKCISIYNIKPSGLRSALIRILPTTLAMVCAEKEGSQTHVYSYWCGDSRNYILTKNGLHQVSIDHLSTPQDPLENLRNDESLSNCICQDKPFSIDTYNCDTYNEPIILLSSTDGCFGYLKSPMHFEYLILSTLEKSNSTDDWEKRIVANLRDISGDDFSLSLIATEGDYDYWKDCLKERLYYINKEYIEPINSLEKDIEEKRKQIEIEKANLYDTVTSLWENYKQDFYAKK